MDELLGELFKPTLPLPRFECADYAPEDRRTRSISPLAEFLKLCQPDPTVKHTKTRMQIEAQKKLEKQQKYKEWFENQVKSYNPLCNRKITGSPSCTAFVARLRYTTTKETLREFFTRFGIVESVHLVVDLNQKSRGYAFIVFAQPQDVETACRGANNALLDGARLVVDTERGRQQRSWLPARLGGGIGGRTKKEVTLSANTNYRGGYAPRGAFAPRARGATRGRGRGSSFGARPYDRPPVNRELHDYDRPRDSRSDSRQRPRVDQRFSRPFAPSQGPRDSRDHTNARDPRDPRGRGDPRDSRSWNDPRGMSDPRSRAPSDLRGRGPTDPRSRGDHHQDPRGRGAPSHPSGDSRPMGRTLKKY